MLEPVSYTQQRSLLEKRSSAPIVSLGALQLLDVVIFLSIIYKLALNRFSNISVCL